MNNIPAEPPTLETERLLLRLLRLDDATDMYAYAQDPLVAEPGMWEPLRSLEESRQDLVETLERGAQGRTVEWGIEHRGDRKLIGRSGFIRLKTEHDLAEIGYALSRAYWSQGLMSEAVRAVLAYGFDVLALHRVEATCLADNMGTIRVLEKAGFQLEGTAREAYRLHGAYKGVRRYGLLSQERA